MSVFILQENFRPITGLLNRGPLKVLNDSKSSRIIAKVPFYTNLYVTGQELFVDTQYDETALVNILNYPSHK